MKKRFLGFLATFCVIGLVATGCTDTEEVGVTNIDGTEKTSFALNETAIFEDVHYTVTDVEYSSGDDFDKPAEGKEYVIVTIKIENKSDSKISYNEFDWKMLNSSGQEDDTAFAIVDSDTTLSSGDLNADGVKTGTLVFEQTIDDSSLKLLYYDNSLFDENSTFDFIITE